MTARVRLGYLAVALAAVSWDTIGVIAKPLFAAGISLWTVVSLCIGITFLIFAVFILVKDPGLLKVQMKTLI